MRELRKHISHPSKQGGQFKHCICLYCYICAHFSVKQAQQSCNTRLKLTKIWAIDQFLLKPKRLENKTEISWYHFLNVILQKQSEMESKRQKCARYEGTGLFGRSFIFQEELWRYILQWCYLIYRFITKIYSTTFEENS